MFDWIGDLFGEDTLGAIDKVLPSKGTVDTASTLLGMGTGLLNANRNRRDAAATVGNLNDIFAPTGAYAKELEQQLARKDAATGRRSQYGPRLANMYSELAKQQANILNSPQYQKLLQAKNGGKFQTVLAGLQKLNQGRSLYNKGQKAYSLLDNYLNPGTGAMDLGGSSAALAGGDTGMAGFGDMIGSNLNTGGVFGPASNYGAPDMLPTQYAGSLDNLGQMFPSSVGDGWLGGAGEFGGTNSALAGGFGGGAGAGAGLGGAGAVDTLGSMFGTGSFLPGYGSTAGSSLFGGGAGAGSGAAAGGSGAGGGGAGALGGAAGALPAAGFAAIAAIVAQGMLKGIFGKPDGPPNSARDKANANAFDATGNLFSPDDGVISYQKGNNYNSIGGRYLTNFDPSSSQIQNQYSWLTPDLYDTFNKGQQAGNTQGVTMSPDMSQWDYNSDNGPLAAYMQSQFGAKPTGGYSQDQYGNAEDYFGNLNYNMTKDYNLGLGGS